MTWQSPQPDLGPMGWLRQLTMTQLWDSRGIEGISFVLPAWSVSAEWLAYLCFPVLVLGVWRIRNWPLPVLGALAVVASSPIALAAVLSSEAGETGAWAWALRIGGGFTSGCYVAGRGRIERTPRVELWAQRIVLGVIAETALVAYWAASAPASAAIPAADRLWFAVPMFPLLLGALCLARGGVVRFLSHPQLQHGGRISYAIYLVHFPLIEITVVAMTRFPALGPEQLARGARRAARAGRLGAGGALRVPVDRGARREVRAALEVRRGVGPSASARGDQGHSPVPAQPTCGAHSRRGGAPPTPAGGGRSGAGCGAAPS